MALSIRVRTRINDRRARAALKALAAIDAKIARKSVKDGVKRAGTKMLGRARSNAPRGKTGLFRRTLAKRDRSYGKGTRHISVVGQRYKKQFPSKSRASARRKNHGLSTGLSGQGLVTPIHLIENRTRRHTIVPKRHRGPDAWLAWIPRTVRGKNGRLRAGGKRDILFAKKVLHPGTRGTKFLRRTAQRYRAEPSSVIRRQIERDLRTVRGY